MPQRTRSFLVIVRLRLSQITAFVIFSFLYFTWSLFLRVLFLLEYYDALTAAKTHPKLCNLWSWARYSFNGIFEKGCWKNRLALITFSNSHSEAVKQSNNTISACFHVAEAAKSAYYLWEKYGFVVNLYNFLQLLCLWLKNVLLLNMFIVINVTEC